MSRAMNQRSVAIELPHSGTLRASRTWCLTYASTASDASASVTPPARSASSPEVVCISRTTSLIWSSASAGGLMIKSIPPSSRVRSESVAPHAISISASRSMSSPVISQSIHTSRSFIPPRLKAKTVIPNDRRLHVVPPATDEGLASQMEPRPLAAIRCGPPADRPLGGGPRPPARPTAGLRGNRQRHARPRGGQPPRPHLQPVRPGDPVDVDGAGPLVVAPGHLRHAEVAAARPSDPAPPLGDGGAVGPVAFRPPGGPAARHAPGVEPAHDGLDPDQRAGREGLARVSVHGDLHAYPALGVHVLRVEPDAPGRPVEVIGRAERASGPQYRDELGNVAGRGVPDEMARAPLADQPLRGRLHGYRARRGAEGQPDDAGRTADQGAPVSIRPDAHCLRQPCVCHGPGSPPRWVWTPAGRRC